MKITNRFDLPDVVVRALVHSDYSRGDSVRSVTQLIDSPRIGILQREHDEEIEQDCVDFLWSRFGTSVHTMFEVAAEGQDCISEERLFVEHQGWKISGAIDLQHVEPDGVIISDYKVTSVWSVIFDKQEWHHQLNAYAWMVRHAKGLPVKQARIIAILRDWQRRKAQEDAGYPQSPITIIDIPVWSEDEQDAYMDQRVQLHQDAEFERAIDGDLPPCSAKERWQKDTTYAVKKQGRARALKIFPNSDAAEIYAASLGDGHSVEERIGESTRCTQNWCRVAQWCDQFQVGEDHGKPEGTTVQSTD